MPITIGKRFSFSAAHRLPLHEGLCKNEHGHNYVLEVEVEGALQSSGSSQNMVLDYGDLKKLVNDKILQWADHCNLNKIYTGAEEMNVTTAENLAFDFAIRLKKTLENMGVKLTRVRLQETPDTWAEWRP